MKTISIQIGNSDNRLSQQQWSAFVDETRQVIEVWASQVHFFGGSSAWEAWQNVAWVFECKDENRPYLRNQLALIRELYNQDSVAYLEGETEFL